MKDLLARAKNQRVVNTQDWKRITYKMNDYDIESIEREVSVIDSINGVKIASLFTQDESTLDRAALQGGINGQEYGKLSHDDKAALPVRNISINDSLEDVGSPAPVMVLRADFDKMNDSQKEASIRNGVEIVNELPRAPLERSELHKIALRIAQQTKQDLDAAGGQVYTDGKED